MTAHYGGRLRLGTDWLPQYTESWANLLDVLGAFEVLTPEHVKTRPIDPRTMPKEMVHPLAFTLKCVALLAGVVGYERKRIINGLPQFEGDGVSLTLEAYNEYAIGTYSQFGEFPPYVSYSTRDVLLSSLLVMGWSTYAGVVFPIDQPPFEFEHSAVLADLHRHRCECSSNAVVALEELWGLPYRAFILLTVDSPYWARLTATTHWKIRETITALAMTCPIWQKPVSALE